MNDKIVLSPEAIYEKEFKIDARGYRPQEVDNFLDIIIKDYSEFIRIVRGYEKEYQKLREENANLKQQIRQLETELESQESSSSDSGVSNVDLLRRISQLEKFVYGKYNNNYTNAAYILCRGKSLLTQPAMVVVFVLREKIT